MALKPKEKSSNPAAFKAALRQLLLDYDMALGVEIGGDTHCLDYRFIAEPRLGPDIVLTESSYLYPEDIE